jgi:glucose-1-phosphate cytidylyltransferase
MGKAVPKAMVPIGGKPLIWHLMRLYTSRGFDEFILCLGFLNEKLVDYFSSKSANGYTHDRWIEIDDDGLKARARLVDTGVDTNTGGRIKAVEEFCRGDERIFVTYGDGLSDVDLQALYEFHLRHGRIATLTAVHPVSTFGLLEIGHDRSVRSFQEKPVLEQWINGGFFVFEREIFNRLEHDSVLEQKPLADLAREGQLMAFEHTEFWKCMDTYKDNVEMNQLWDQNAPWKVW